MLDGTYPGTLASVADFLNRGDLTPTIPDFIILTEADMNRKLRTRLMTARTTTTINAQYDTLPVDFAGVISMQNVLGKPINARDPDAMALITTANIGAGSNITDYAVIGGSFQFYPIPVANQIVVMSYYQRIPALSLNPTGNWISLKHPDAYLYGALTAAAPYMQDDDRLSVWSGLYQNAIDSILAQDMGERYGARLTPQPSVLQIV